jgi:mannose-6-phosphate isomerase-like protein (cupin superfamily)
VARVAPVNEFQSRQNDMTGSADQCVPVNRDRPTHPHILIRHEGSSPRERSTCGFRDRLISREDVAANPAAWAHAVDIDGARPHFHRRSTELYYVLEGEGFVLLDGAEHPVRKGSIIHIPPGVVHGARGRMRVLVVGIPDIAEDDYFEP